MKSIVRLGKSSKGASRRRKTRTSAVSRPCDAALFEWRPIPPATDRRRCRNIALLPLYAVLTSHGQTLQPSYRSLMSISDGVEELLINVTADFNFNSFK